MLVAVAGVVEEAGRSSDDKFGGSVRCGIDAEERGLGVSRTFAGERQVDVGIAALRGNLRSIPGSRIGDADLIYGTRCLVEDDLFIADIVSNAGSGVETNIAAVGVEVAAELGRGVLHNVAKTTTASAGELSPGRAGPDIQLVLIGSPRKPAFARSVEFPYCILIGGDPPGLAGPGTRRTRRYDVARAIRRRARWRGQILVEHHQLNHRVQRAQGFVVRNVLLRLGGHNEGKIEIAGCVHIDLLSG